jgi:ribosomal protein S27AE
MRKEATMDENSVYLCQVCENGEAEFVADNNADKFARWYCGKCEEHRSDKWGCALILAEGAMCDEGACGCGGTGVL